MGVNSLPKTVTGQRRDCDLNPGPSVPESSTLTTGLLRDGTWLKCQGLYTLCFEYNTHARMHTHTRLMARFSGLPG